LFAFFNQTPVTGDGGNPQTPPVVEVEAPEDEAKLKAAHEKAAAAAKEVGELEASVFPRINKSRPASESVRARGLPKEVRDALKPAAGQRNRAQLTELEKHFAKTEPKYAEKLKALV